MHNFFTPFRALQQEMDAPCTSFMQFEVEVLVSDIQNESEERYKIREETFCEEQSNKHEKKPKDPQNNLLNYAQEQDSGYVAEHGLLEIVKSDDGDSWEEVLDEKLDTAKERKALRKNRKYREAYLSHRIKRDIKELYNGRQFIRQSENILRKMGGAFLEAMNRVREQYFEPQSVVSDDIIHECMDFARDVDTKDAEAFEARMDEAQEHNNI